MGPGSPNNLVVAYAYAYPWLISFLVIGAAFYCYRLTRRTGTFRAWTLMIAALVVLAFGALASSIRAIAFDSASRLEQTIQQTGATMYVLQSAYGLILSTLLFLSMFELYAMFGRSREAREQSERGEASATDD